MPGAARADGEKLAKPTADQAAWQDCELGMFIHFGPATWQDVGEDNLSTPLDQIIPDKLDTEQWVRAAEAMGAKYIVFVAKHSGGFCWWQTDTTDYSVKNTPWRGGKGDVLAELSASCKKHGMKLGVYISPMDRKHKAAGGGRCATPELQAAYNKLYRQQLTEVLSRYGSMFEVWFDGSNVVPVGDILRQYAPHAMIFQGPHATIRWVGNEDGIAPYPAWNSLSIADARSGVATARQGNPDGAAWLPNECDAEFRDAWMWNSKNAGSLKSVERLMEIYDGSVGHGAVLLLNHSPDRTGLIPAADFERGKQFGDEIRHEFAHSLAETSGHGNMVELPLAKPATIDRLVLMENIVDGERVREFVVEVQHGGEWRPLFHGSAIGHKQIIRFAPTEATAVRLRVSKSAAEPEVRKLAVYEADRLR
ncbi:MAG TPA: alpha-L-fucosidase [Pirellulales bacterium]|jgi:alpha-L-fucosidase|nr:alpha-L-fucosidase [Pirellulales bacterium]